MIQEYQIRILPEQAANEQNIKLFISKDKGIDARTIKAIRVLKRSIDARQRTIFVNLKVRLYINELPQDEEFTRTIYNNVEGKPQIIVVGAGPGGLFAALRLIELGLRPGDCSHEIKRCLLLGRKVMTNLDSVLKSRDITLPTKFHIVKALVFPVVMYGCE